MWRTIRKKWGFYTALLLLSCLPLFHLYRLAYAPIFRGGMVEDGSVSQYAGDLIDSRTIREKWHAIMESDGKAGGRFRPFCLVYDAIPFWMNLVKTGDLDLSLSGDELKRRINGDRRFHAVYLLASVAVSLLMGGLAIYRIGKSTVLALLFPVVMAYTPTITWNIIVNDAAEVPQVLCLSAFWLILALLAGRSSHSGTGACALLAGASLVLAIAFPIKETTVAMTGALLLLAAMLTWVRVSSRGAAFPVVERAACWHAWLLFILSCVLSLWVWRHIAAFAGGGYAAHYSRGPWSEYLTNLGVLWRFLGELPGTSYLPLVGYITLAVGVCRATRTGSPVHAWSPLAFCVASAMLVLALAFLAVNLPWKWALSRYMFPSAFFMALCGCLAWAVVERSLHLSGHRRTRMALLVLLSLLVVFPVRGQYRSIRAEQQMRFSRQKILSPLLMDVRETIAHADRAHICVLFDVTRDMFPDTGLQLARILNQEDRMNVCVVDGSIYGERYYMRKWENAKTISILASDSLDRKGQTVDLIYSTLPFDRSLRTKKRERQYRELHSSYRFAGSIVWQGYGRAPEFEILKFTLASDECRL